MLETTQPSAPGVNKLSEMNHSPFILVVIDHLGSEDILRSQSDKGCAPFTIEIVGVGVPFKPATPISCMVLNGF